jgi:Fe-S-cluster containining protein
MNLNKIYKKIPSLKCPPGCSACCGPVPLCSKEASVLKDLVKDNPDKSLLEGLNSFMTPTDPDLNCKFSSAKGCTVYENRPLMCRLFGTVESLKCPLGCAPSRYLTRAEENDLMTFYKNLK